MKRSANKSSLPLVNRRGSVLLLGFLCGLLPQVPARAQDVNALATAPASAPALTPTKAPAPASGADAFPDSDLPAVKQTTTGDLLDRRTEAAINRALQALKQSQDAGGGWGGEDTNRTGYTALAMIAYMLNGHFPSEKAPYGPVMKKGLEELLRMSKSGTDGFMGTNMYAHGLATLALSELWGQTDRDDEVREALKAGIRVILRSQSPIGGWRYNPIPGDADVSVTAMQLIALAAARQAGILVPNQVIDRAIRYIHLCRDETSGGFSYVPNGGHGGAGLGKSAAATFSLMMCGRHESPEVKGGIRYIEGLPDSKFRKTDFYMYAQYYCALVMSQAGDEHFKAWYPRIRDVLLETQKSDGNWGLDYGPPAYSTAMSVIVLAVPYSFVPAYQR